MTPRGNPAMGSSASASSKTSSASVSSTHFWELGGRLGLEAATDAKARETEEVHGLPIDEEHHRRVFREFSSLGALGAAELTVEAASLLQRCPTGEALDYFIGLVVDRARIGLPPYPRFAADVRRLIDAAGADRVAVENCLLRDLLETAYLSRAPEDFWKTY